MASPGVGVGLQVLETKLLPFEHVTFKDPEKPKLACC